jgi:hypothetical protein
MTLTTAPNVVRRSGVPPATYIRGNGGARRMSGFFYAFSSAEEAIANAKMNHSRCSHIPVCGGYGHAR